MMHGGANKALQPTRAAGPNGQREPARVGPRDDLRHAHDLYARSLCLPSSPDLLLREVRRCVEVVVEAV